MPFPAMKNVHRDPYCRGRSFGILGEIDGWLKYIAI